jgi:hypothetical protein
MSAVLEIAASPADHEPVSPTITEAERLASRIDALIDSIEALLPTLERPHPKTGGNARAARTVPREFVETMIGMIGDEPDWQRLGFFDAAGAQATLQFADAFRPVSRRLVILAARLNFTVASRTATIAIAAMNTYMMAKRYARRPTHEATVSRIAKLRAALGRRNGAGKPHS